MAYERYSKERSTILASRRSANQRDAYSRKTIGSTGSEVMPVGPSTKVLEEIKASDPEGKHRFGLVAFKELMGLNR